MMKLHKGTGWVQVAALGEGGGPEGQAEKSVGDFPENIAASPRYSHHEESRDTTNG